MENRIFEICIIVVLVLSVPIGFFLFRAHRNQMQKAHLEAMYVTNAVANACINNLRATEGAAEQFALEHHLTNGARINYPSDLTPYIHMNYSGKIPSCPSGGTYHISKVGERPTCSLGTTVTPAHVLP